MLPLIITKGCKFPEVDIYKAGVSVDYNKHHMVNEIINLLKNPKLLKLTGYNAKKLIQKHYTIDSMVNNLIKIYYL